MWDGSEQCTSYGAGSGYSTDGADCPQLQGVELSVLQQCQASWTWSESLTLDPLPNLKLGEEINIYFLTIHSLDIL